MFFLVVRHLWQLLGACESDSESGNLEAAQATPQSTQNASASSLPYPTPIQVVKATNEVSKASCTTTQSNASAGSLPYPTPIQVVNATNEVPKAECTMTQSDAKNSADDQNQPKAPPTNEVDHIEKVVLEGIGAVDSMMQEQDKLQSPESPIFLRDMVSISKKRKKNDDGEWLLCYIYFLRHGCASTMFLLSHS